MALRKEPIVFLGVLAFCGWKVSTMLAEKSSTPRPRSSSIDFVSHLAPDLAIALPEAGRSTTFERNLFAPPSATSPLPPLLPELPPLEALGALQPPTGFGPAPKAYGMLLRTSETPSGAAEVPGLFASDEGFGGGEEEEVSVFDEPLEMPDDPDARAARIAGLKKQYDWLYTNGIKFGWIRNAERYTLVGLDMRPKEDAILQFVEIDISKGTPLYGDIAIDYEPEQLSDFGLVDIPLTEIEVGLASFGDPIAKPRFDEAIKFARRCLLLRNETPRALEVAEEMFRRAQAINTQDDVAPRLGLARCYELGFRLEDAYKVYEELLEGGFEVNPVVHARLGTLLATLRMDGDAESRFNEALRVGRSNWEARWRFGTFLLEHGRSDEALVQLTAAATAEPKGDENQIWRVRVRLDAARAEFAVGNVDAAMRGFTSAVSADALNDVGLLDQCAAGLLTAARFSDLPEAKAMVEAAAGASSDPADGNFDVLLASGLFAIENGRYQEAARTLQVARGADPFRAHEALRGLSYLAEVSGNPEDAESFALEALRAHPMDAWTLYHAGRLAERSFDERQARAAYRAALDLELDFSPALERMAALLNANGEYAAAERYFDRAVEVVSDRAPSSVRAGIWSRRGWNALAVGDLTVAKTAFDQARSLSPSLASSRAGLAWYQYAAGNTSEAITLFGEIVDDRRASSDDIDPYVVFAELQQARILEHESKEVFRDRFDRADGRIGNGWKEDKGVGPLSALREASVGIDGQHERGGRTRVFRELPPDRFIAFSAELTVGAKAKGTRSGIFVSQEKQDGAGAVQVRSEIVISRSRDGDLEVRVQKSPTDEDAVFKIVPGPSWPVGEPIRVSIERSGTDLSSRWTLYVDGEPVAADIDVGALTSARQSLRFGAFVDGETGRRADLIMDDVRVVRRK